LVCYFSAVKPLSLKCTYVVVVTAVYICIYCWFL
jgi:hypothetical protein